MAVIDSQKNLLRQIQGLGPLEENQCAGCGFTQSLCACYRIVTEPQPQAVAKSPVTLELPWPPSDNALTRAREIPAGKNQPRCRQCDRPLKTLLVMFPTDEKKKYLLAVDAVLLEKNLPRLVGPLHLDMQVYPPDRRTIDGPNRMKVVQDALKRREIGRRKKGCKPQWDPKQAAWLFATDDSQVVSWSGKLRGIVPGGKVVVTLTPLPDELALLENTETAEDACPPPEE